MTCCVTELDMVHFHPTQLTYLPILTIHRPIITQPMDRYWQHLHFVSMHMITNNKKVKVKLFIILHIFLHFYKIFHGRFVAYQ